MRAAPVVLFACLMLALVRGFVSPLRSPDTWWNLHMGAAMWDGRTLRPVPNSFATVSAIPTEWAPDVLAARFEQWFGLAGVNWLFALGVVAAVLALYTTCRDMGEPLAATAATAVGVIGMGQSLTPRPQLVTFALVAVVIRCSIRMSADLRPRWWLVPLTWVWACCHGMWFLGPMVLIVGIGGLLLDRRVTLRRAGHLVMVPVASIVAAGLTPIGPALLTTPFAVAGVTKYITEWQAPSFRTLWPALVMTSIAVVALAWSRRGRASWHRLGLLVMALGWTVLSVRTVALGSLFIAPLLAHEIQRWIPDRGGEGRGDVNWARAIGAAVLVITGAALAIHPPRVSPTVPSGLNERLSVLPRGSVVLAESAASSWLEWAHPDLRPTVDGWSETFSSSYAESYLNTMSVGEGWETFIQRDRAHYALVVEHSPIATALKQRLHWKSLGTSANYILLAAPATRS